MTAAAGPVAAAFLADIIAHPGEDATRLIFADWLDDRGDVDRAAFIRVQCELARNFVADEVPDPARVSVPGGKVAQAYARETYRRWRALRDREWAHHSFHVKGWLGPFAALFRTSHLRTAEGQDHEGSWCVWRRGFVAEVALPCAAWLRHGPALARAAPLEVVRLSDKRPREQYLSDAAPVYEWHGGTDCPVAYCLRWDLFKCLPGWDAQDRMDYPSPAAAQAALSAAALALARVTSPGDPPP